MPEFTPNYQAVATVKITVKPAGLLSFAELSLVRDSAVAATSGLIEFNSTGQEQTIDLPIAMPNSMGTYEVYLDVVAADILVGAYQALEDVVIGGITGYAMSVVQAPEQVNGGQTYSIVLHTEIPASELYPAPRQGGEVSEARFGVQLRLMDSAQGASDGWGNLPIGAADTEISRLRTIDWWFGNPLTPGIYNLEIRLTRGWTETIPGYATWSYSDLPMGDYTSYATIEII